MAVVQRYRLGVQYFGRQYAGWQIQPDCPTVQGVLEKAIHKLVARKGACGRITGSSRTDSGVHAIRNVCHVDITRNITGKGYGAPLDAVSVQNAINAFLTNYKHDILVTDVAMVSEDWHARFNAIGRSYVYNILASPTIEEQEHHDLLHHQDVGGAPATPPYSPSKPSRDPSIRTPEFHGSPFLNPYAHLVREPLDVEAMQAVCPMLLGEHDFSNFRSVKCQAKSPIKTLTDLRVDRGLSGGSMGLSPYANNGQLLQVSISANSFLHNMVRHIVGALLAVGKGKMDAEALHRLLKNHDSSHAFKRVAPAHGLFLVGVHYPAEEEEE